MNIENQLMQAIIIIGVPAFFWLAYTYMAQHAPMIQNHIKHQHNILLQDAMQLAWKIGYNTVAELATKSNLTNTQKQRQAFNYIVQRLTQLGYNKYFDDAAILKLVESAYQSYKTSGGDVNKYINNATEHADNKLENSSNLATAQSDTTTGTGQHAPANPYAK